MLVCFLGFFEPMFWLLSHLDQILLALVLTMISLENEGFKYAVIQHLLKGFLFTCAPWPVLSLGVRFLHTFKCCYPVASYFAIVRPVSWSSGVFFPNSLTLMLWMPSRACLKTVVLKCWVLIYCSSFRVRCDGCFSHLKYLILGVDM